MISRAHKKEVNMSRHHNLRCVTLLFVVLATMALAATPAFAGKEYVPGVPSSFGPEGEGVGQLAEPGGMAVNDSTELGNEQAGDVYVIDRGLSGGAHYSVEYFNSAGVYVGQFEAPPGGFGDLSGIAVDNDPLSPSSGDVYVSDREDKVIDKFSSEGKYLGQLKETTGGSLLGQPEAVAVDPSGNLWVYEREGAGSSGILDEFTDTGVFVKAFKTEHEAGFGIAVDSSGNVYVTSDERVLKFDAATGSKLAEFGEHAKELAIDPSTENLLVDNNTSGIALYGPNPGDSSTPIETFPSAGLTESNEIAVNGEGTVYTDNGRSSDLIEVFSRVLFPDVTVEAASSVTQTTATLGGTVNPDESEAASPGEAALTKCQFEYGTEAGTFTNTVQCSPTAASIVGEQHVSAHLTGLRGGTVYHYRLLAENVNGPNPNHPSQEQELLTTGPELSGESVSDVASTSATFNARVNPRELPTTYYFQYSTANAAGCATSPSSCTDVPAAPGEAIGSGDSDVPVSQPVQGLLADTTYHYRIVVVSEPRLGKFKTSEGPDQTFTTQTAGGASGASGLPDGREWELVSPPDKHGAQISLPFLAGDAAVVQAAEAGGAITYYASGPTEAEPAGSVLFSQVLSKRGSDGWSSQDIAPPHELPVEPRNETSSTEDVFFSSDLSDALVEPTPNVSNATEKNLYLRNSATGAYEPLATASNLLSGTKLVGLGEEHALEFITATPDLSHVILRSHQPLTAQGGGNENYYYEWTGGQLKLITQGNRASGSGSAVYIGSHIESYVDRGAMRHAISDDGSRIFWGAGGTVDAALFMTDVVTGEVVHVSKAQGIAEPPSGHAEFQDADSDGSEVFFSDEAQLTTTPGGGLYVYDAENGRLTLLSVPINASEAAGVRGQVLGASEDGAYVYFVAHGVLSENKNAGNEQAVAGADNLYMSHSEPRNGATEWKTSFIAALGAEDEPDWLGMSNEGGLFGFHLDNLTARVSPDGGYLAFMSDRSLTGYDNIDVNEETGRHADEEVFLYDASSGRLVCASCDPTGARPAGRLEPGVAVPSVDLSAVWRGRWVAGSVPGWVAYDGEGAAVYQSRYLADGGRLFFDSPDALASQDTNGAEDVYEYEPEGVGSCSTSSSVFSERSGGCVGLISGGKGDQESAFADASANGSDVFFVTTDRLVPGDVDNAYDMYDAHVCTGSSPCLPPSAAQPPECVTADACRAAPTPQPAIFGAPSSATFNGAGNITPSAPAGAKPKPKQKTVKCAKGKKLNHGKCVKTKKSKKAKKAKKSSNDRRAHR
jgi:hypothetical protein